MKLGKYWYVATTSARHTLASPAGLIGRVALFVVILTIFSRLWRVAFAGGTAPIGDAADLTWYMAVTEWVALAVPFLHYDIEKDVRSGDLASQLPRPCSYLGVQLARGLGITAVQFACLVTFGSAATWALAGSGPDSLVALLLAVPLAAIAAGLLALVATLIGLGAFWITDTAPLHWVWQKLLFILGGLILPVSLYPELLQKIARCTPFAAILNGPAELMRGDAGPAFAEATLRLGAWTVLIAFFARWLYAKALTVVDVSGG